MKKKAIEQVAPVQPQMKRKEKYVTTVQAVNNLLVLNVFKDGELRCRHALDPETGEYSQYRVKIKDWKAWKYAVALDIKTNTYGWFYSSDKGRCVFDTPEQEQIVREALAKNMYAFPDPFDLIDEIEKKYQRDKKEKTENNRLMRVQEKMAMVPEIPEGIQDWIWQQEGALDFAFYDKAAGEYFCTGCGKKYPEKHLKKPDGSKVRHNDMAVCPRCGKLAMAKRRVQEMEVKTHFALLQRINEKMSVLRHFDAKIVWNKKGRGVYTSEATRLVMWNMAYQPKYAAELYYNQVSTVYRTPGVDYEYSYFDNKGNPANRREFVSYLYPEGIGEALDGTAYQSWGRLFSQMAAAHKKANYNRLMAARNNGRLIGVVEYLSKGRFEKLLVETSECIHYWDGGYWGPLDIAGDSIEEIFGIRDRQAINRIREVDGGHQILGWMRWSEQEGQKISQECLEWLCSNHIERSSLDFIKGNMSVQQVMNYVRRQQAEGYRSKTAKQVLGQWEDYLSMLQKLGKKTDDEMMYRPRELKRRHDECVEEINRRQRIEEMKRDRRQRQAAAKRYREKFPGAEDILKEIKSKYEYRNGDYIIVVPQKLIDIVTEGQSLHHCAGATDRYFDRIMQHETYICFLRKASDPKTPYYTIEVEPGGTIRQHRGYLDEEPDIKEIKPFLREWQKEVRKRMSREDHERAAVSAVKRQENIEELKANNNTRVLNGLMEDFMEAM